ncbi:MAG: type II toxin-antitoxin system Phd/YefM family antitoxin [Propionibacteriaceae bacterium]|jgi:prevent-host-death family protein|nr:type II toxin-antitoxin system Phd/YefM family antitoxin [Propionibacteriaceae bacterium]
MTTTLPLAEVRADLSRLVDAAVRTHERVEVTRRGRREAILMSADDYDSLIETLDILADAAVVRELAEARAEMAAGQWFGQADVAASMRGAERP